MNNAARPHAIARTFMGLIVAGLLALIAGCASRHAGPYQPLDGASRDPALAERLNGQAAALVESDPAKAEALLRDALNADLYLGPAHNNLGVIYLMQDKLYEAAGEFEWARKLMPGHPDPRINLALTLERAGRTNDALSSYIDALDAYPNHVAALQGLARLQLRAAKPDGRIRPALETIALRGETPAWREWARRQLALAGDSAVSR